MQSTTLAQADLAARLTQTAYHVALAAVLFEAELLLDMEKRRGVYLASSRATQRARLAAAIQRARLAEDARDAALHAVLAL